MEKREFAKNGHVGMVLVDPREAFRRTVNATALSRRPCWHLAFARATVTQKPRTCAARLRAPRMSIDRHIGSGINVDSIRQNFGRRGWGMAVNDPLPEVHGTVEEFFADPSRSLTLWR